MPRCPDPPRDGKLSASGTRDLVRDRPVDWRRYALYHNSRHVHGCHAEKDEWKGVERNDSWLDWMYKLRKWAHTSE